MNEVNDYKMEYIINFKNTHLAKALIIKSIMQENSLIWELVSLFLSDIILIYF
jgi:hypothetical protein